MNNEILLQKQRNFRATGLAVFVATLGLLIYRVINSYLGDFMIANMNEAAAEILIDTIGTVIIQIGLMVVCPILIFKFYGKKTTKETFAYSNFRKTNWKIIVFSFIIGLCAVVVTMFVVNVWLIILRLMGYSYTPGETYMLEKFNVFHLLLMLFLTAVLPGFCEEFICRGCLTGTMRNTFSKTTTIIIGGLWFGLFHQYIVQMSYTTLMGMLLVYLVLETKSIWPCIVIHFTNNATSVITEFWSTYKFFGVNPSAALISFISNNFLIAIFAVFVCLALIIILVRQIRIIYARSYTKNFEEMIQSDNIEGDMSKMITPFTSADYARYKPVLKDSIFFIGALFVTVINTVLSFVWGLF